MRNIFMWNDTLLDNSIENWFCSVDHVKTSALTFWSVFDWLLCGTLHGNLVWHEHLMERRAFLRLRVLIRVVVCLVGGRNSSEWNFIVLLESAPALSLDELPFHLLFFFLVIRVALFSLTFVIDFSIGGPSIKCHVVRIVFFSFFWQWRASTPILKYCTVRGGANEVANQLVFSGFQFLRGFFNLEGLIVRHVHSCKVFWGAIISL